MGSAGRPVRLTRLVLLVAASLLAVSLLAPVAAAAGDGHPCDHAPAACEVAYSVLRALDRTTGCVPRLDETPWALGAREHVLSMTLASLGDACSQAAPPCPIGQDAPPALP